MSSQCLSFVFGIVASRIFVKRCGRFAHRTIFRR